MLKRKKTNGRTGRRGKPSAVDDTTELFGARGQIRVSADLIPNLSPDFKAALESTRLTPIQLYAAQLLSTGLFTQGALARHFGVHEKTVEAWVKKDDFRAVVAMTGGDRLALAADLLASLVPLAVITLAEIMTTSEDDALRKEIAVEILRGKSLLAGGGRNGDGNAADTPGGMPAHGPLPQVTAEEKFLIVEALRQAVRKGRSMLEDDPDGDTAIEIRPVHGSVGHLGDGPEEAGRSGGVHDQTPQTHEADSLGSGQSTGEEVPDSYLDGKVTL